MLRKTVKSAPDSEGDRVVFKDNDSAKDVVKNARDVAAKLREEAKQGQEKKKAPRSRGCCSW